jgi:signal transduction histidine kinase
MRNVAILIFLVCLSGCTFSPNTQRIIENPLVQPDTLWTPTGDAELDSLLQLAATSPVDTNLAKLYSNIGYLYMNYDFEMAKEYLLKLKNLSEMLDFNYGRYKFSADFTGILNYEGYIDSSIFILQQVHDIALKENNELQTGKILVNLGNCYNYKQWYETALQYYKDALLIFEKMNDKKLVAHVYSLMTIVYSKIKMNEEAMLYSKKAVDMMNDEPDALGRGTSLCNYASQLLNNHKLEEAEQCLMEAERIVNLNKASYFLIQIYSSFSDLFLQKRDYDKEKIYAQKTLELSEQYGNIEGYCVATRTLAYLELYKLNFSQSEKKTKEALELAEEYELPVEQYLCYSLLGDIYTAKHDFKNAYINATTSLDIFSNITSEQKTHAIGEIEVKYETVKKDLEIERQQHIISKQNLHRNLLIGGTGACIVILVLLWVLLRQRNKKNLFLAEMNATKDKFFTIISHDLKNPAVAQQQAMQMLLENAKLWDAETLEQYCHGLMKSADGLVDLLYNLLNWAQLQTGRMPFKPVLFDLASDMRDTTATLFYNMAEHKNLTLSTELPDSALLTADINMIKTVVRNLIDNAIKFTLPGGSIKLSVTPKENGKFIISVTDTGVGMNETQIRNLFRINNGRDAMHCISTKGTANESGTGLGLIVCKELLEKHDSTLHIESEESKGSTFWFELS